MTLCHVHANDPDFDLKTLAQSGDEVLELGILAYPSDSEAAFDAALESYLTSADVAGATGTYTFDFFSNGAIYGPLTTHYDANGAPNADGSEMWKVYMVVWSSVEDYENAGLNVDELKSTTVQEHSSIDIATRSTSLVCCKTDQCVLDPDECNVGVLGFEDTWASNCAQCPRPCATDYDVCSLLSTKTCLDIGGTVKESCDGSAMNGSTIDENVEATETTSGAKSWGLSTIVLAFAFIVLV